MKKEKKKRKSPTVYKEIQKELEDSSIIYKLGGEPIYIHTKPANAKIGLKTAEKDIVTALGEAQDTAKAELDKQLQYLQKKREAGEKKLGGASQFKSLMQNVFLNEKLDLKQKITTLLELKSTITAFSSLQAYKKERTDNQNIDKLTLKINSKNIVVNATNADSVDKSLKIKMADLIKELDDQDFNNTARVHIDKLLGTLTKDKSRVTKFNNKEMSADIG